VLKPESVDSQFEELGLQKRNGIYARNSPKIFYESECSESLLCGTHNLQTGEVEVFTLDEMGETRRATDSISPLEAHLKLQRTMGIVPLCSATPTHTDYVTEVVRRYLNTTEITPVIIVGIFGH